jgi:hypothetical protein
VLTGNNLGQLGNAEHLPTVDELQHADVTAALDDLQTRFQHDAESMEYHRHLLAKEFLEEGKLMEAWKVLLS